MTKEITNHQISFNLGRQLATNHAPHHVRRERGLNMWLLEYTISGEATLNLGEGVWTSAAGTAFLYLPNTPQNYSAGVENPPWDHLWASFVPRPHWHPMLAWPKLAPGIHAITLHNDVQSRAIQLLTDALNFYTRGYGSGRDLAHLRIEEFLLLGHNAHQRTGSSHTDDRILRVCDWVTEHLAEPMTVTTLAQSAGWSPSRFAHLFTKIVGVSPMKYVELRRLDRAKDLLEMTNLPVQQVAASVGFDCPFYFSRIFRRQFGHPPSATHQPLGKFIKQESL